MKNKSKISGELVLIQQRKVSDKYLKAWFNATFYPSQVILPKSKDNAPKRAIIAPRPKTPLTIKQTLNSFIKKQYDKQNRFS